MGSLSDKQKIYYDESVEDSEPCYKEEDVKDFIKKLKEGIHDFNELETGDKWINDFIDKLAGEKLI
jgi:hypothetical protein